MLKLHLVGVGAGDPELLTLQAIRVLNSVDVILIPCKSDGKEDLARLRHAICARYVHNPKVRYVAFDMPRRDETMRDYRARVDDWHDAIARIWEQRIRECAQEAGADIETAALLVWGDPSLYDSTLRIAQRLTIAHDVEVTPAVSSLQALAAAHKIALNAIGAAFMVMTGRGLREQGFPANVDRVAVMLDGDCAFQALKAEGFEMWWGAYLGLPQQILISGPLSAVGERIIAARTAARARYGWIMDIYILQRRPGA